MIIKLTEMRKDGPYPTYVNMDHVQYFSKSMNGNDTRLKIAGDNLYLFVKESVEEIAALMHPVAKVRSLSEVYQMANDALEGAR